MLSVQFGAVQPLPPGFFLPAEPGSRISHHPAAAEGARSRPERPPPAGRTAARRIESRSFPATHSRAASLAALRKRRLSLLRGGKNPSRGAAAENGRPTGAAIFRAQSACFSFAEISLGTFPRNYRLLISHSSGKIRSSRSRVPSRSIGFSSFEFQDNSTILCSHPGKIARNRARKRKIFFPGPVFEIFPSAPLTSRADRGILHFAGDLPVWRNW